MKTSQIQLETEITISYEEFLRKSAVALYERIIVRGITGYENRLQEARDDFGHLIFHLFPQRYCESEFYKEIAKVESEGVNLHTSRLSMNQIPTTIFRHKENPNNTGAIHQ